MGTATVSAPTIDLRKVILYGQLVQLAEAVPTDKTVYNPGDVTTVAYDALSVNYTVVSTFYGNDLATDITPENLNLNVSFGFVVQDAHGGVVVVIRGTIGIYEWLQDARFLAVRCPFLAGAGQTEDGFTAVYESMNINQGGVSQRLSTALLHLPYGQPVTSITICGHSLGGALVTLLALDFAANEEPTAPLLAVTFASPRTGDPSFADTYNQVVPNTVRITNRFDLVPKLPTPPLYEHVAGNLDLNPGLTVKVELNCQHDLQTYLHLLSTQTGGSVLPIRDGCKLL